MQIATIEAENRTKAGGNANVRLRKRGMVPGVVYGHGKQPELVSASLHDLEIALADLAHVVSLKIDGAETQYLIKEVQLDHFQKTPLHIDLMRIDPNERVRVNVQVVLKGEPQGIHEGGVLVHVITEIEVECGVLAIPDAIRGGIAHLAIGDALHVRELEVPEGVTPIPGPDDIVATVHIKRSEEEEAETVQPETSEGGPEPEVIGRTAKESEGEGGASS